MPVYGAANPAVRTVDNVGDAVTVRLSRAKQVSKDIVGRLQRVSRATNSSDALARRCVVVGVIAIPQQTVLGVIGGGGRIRGRSPSPCNPIPVQVVRISS